MDRGGRDSRSPSFPRGRQPSDHRLAPGFDPVADKAGLLYGAATNRTRDVSGVFIAGRLDAPMRRLIVDVKDLWFRQIQVLVVDGSAKTGVIRWLLLDLQRPPIGNAEIIASRVGYLVRTAGRRWTRGQRRQSRRIYRGEQIV